MGKSKLGVLIILIVLILILIGGIVVYILKEKLSAPETFSFIKEAKKLALYVSPYESTFLFDENKVFSAKGYSPHVLSQIPYMPYDTFRDLAKDVCRTAGDYHLITMEEWGILAQAAREENLMPLGNNKKTFSLENPQEKCEKDPKKEGVCLTGTGPDNWCYDGICDLNGNLSEWVNFGDVIDGVVKIDEKEFTLMPANYDMEKVLTQEGVEELIPQNIDPVPNEKYVSGSSVKIDTESGEYNYPKVIPIKKDTVLGDFDQFRNGEGKKYGDGKYYLWIPTYDKNNDGIEDGAKDVGSEVLICNSFDGNNFKDCKNHRGLKIQKSQIRKDQRISSVIPSMLFPPVQLSNEYILQVKGFITSLRNEPELEKLAIPALVSLVPKKDYGEDIFKIAPYGTRYALRGGDYNEGIGSGIFYLEILIDQMNIKYWDITYRCVKDYKEVKETKPSSFLKSEGSLVPVVPEERPSLENTWVKVLGSDNHNLFYNIAAKGDDIYTSGLERNAIYEGNTRATLIHLNSQGKLFWSKVLTSSSEENNPILSISFSTKITNKDDSVSTGWLQEEKFATNGEDIFLIKVNKDGELIWKKILSGKQREIGFNIIQTKDEGYVITGSVFTSLKENSDIIVVRLDKNGNILWAKTFDSNYFDIAYSVAETSGGEILVGGRFADKAGFEELGIWHYYADEKAILMKLDKNGNILWAETFGGNFGNARIFSVEETLDNDYLIGGETYSEGMLKDESSSKMEEDFQSKVFLVKFNKEGEIKWGKTFGFDRVNLVASATEDKDGNYIATTYSGPTIGREMSPFNCGLFKFSSGGEVLFKRIFTIKGRDRGFSVTATENGYFVSGKSMSLNQKGLDEGLLLRFNQEGDIKNCSFVKTPDENSFFLRDFKSDSFEEISLKESSYTLKVRESTSLSLEDLILEEKAVCPAK